MKAGIYGSNPGNVRNFRKYQFVNMYYSYLFTEVLVKIADTSVSFYVWTKIWIDFYGSNDQNEQKFRNLGHQNHLNAKLLRK